MGKQSECPCCLESKWTHAFFKCQHHICSACNSKWRRQRKGNCPTCRAEPNKPLPPQREHLAGLHAYVARVALDTRSDLSSEEVANLVQLIIAAERQPELAQGGVAVVHTGGQTRLVFRPRRVSALAQAADGSD